MHDHGRLRPHHRDHRLDAGRERRQRTIALGTLCLCALTTGLDMTITNLALPFIGRSLGLVGGGVLFTLFVRRELAVRAPLFDVRILARPAVVSGAVTLFMAYPSPSPSPRPSSSGPACPC